MSLKDAVKIFNEGTRYDLSSGKLNFKASILEGGQLKITEKDTGVCIIYLYETIEKGSIMTSQLVGDMVKQALFLMAKP
jgi:hypothetical protein